MNFLNIPFIIRYTHNNGLMAWLLPVLDALPQSKRMVYSVRFFYMPLRHFIIRKKKKKQTNKSLFQ